MNIDLEQKLSIRALKIQNEYQITIAKGIPIKLYVDGVCENPGPMHIGLFSVQGEATLFAEHFAVGDGTCNEAEYIAVKSGLTLLRLLIPDPGLPILVHSDSQLVVQQVAGRWRSNGEMQKFCLELRKLQRVYPFDLQKIPREENRVADSLAQKYLSKNAGRCLTIDDGRFTVSKAAMENVKNSDLFNAVMKKEAFDYFKRYNLNDDIKELKRLALDGQKATAIQIAREIEEKSIDILDNVPPSNAMVATWMKNTVEIIQARTAEIVEAIEAENEGEIQYLIDELSFADNSGEEFIVA